jgi:hypothetical protein
MEMGLIDEVLKVCFIILKNSQLAENDRASL